jgi:exonuclease SbcC
MYVKRVRVENIGPIEKFETELKRGLVGIIGRNGSGKTTLVNLIYAGLTNDFGRFIGTKVDQIYKPKQEDPKAKAFVRIDAEHDGTEFSITRSLRPNKSELVVGEEKITKANEIEFKLRTELGVDMQIIENYVFVDQRQMFGFLNQTPSERADAFKHLCRTGKAEHIFDACASLMAGSDFTADVVDNSDELVTEIGELDARREVLVNKLAKRRKKLLNEKSLASANSLITKANKLATKAEELAELEPKLSEYWTARKAAKKGLTSAEQVRARGTETANKLKAAHDKASTALALFEQYERRCRQRAKLKVSLTTVETELASLKPPKPPEFLEEDQKIANDRAALQLELSRARLFLETLEETGATECPTCHQPVNDPKFIAQQKKIVERHPGIIQPLTKKLEEIAAYHQCRRDYTQTLTELQSSLKSKKEELGRFVELDEPSGNKEELQRDVNLYTTAQDALAGLQKNVENATRKYASAKATHKAAKKQIAKLRKVIEHNQVDAELHARAVARKAEHDEYLPKVANLEGKIEEIDESRKTLQTALDNLRAVLNRKKKLRRAGKVLATVRDAFHWKNLPRRVAHGNLLQMEETINEQLNMLGDPFWVEADDQLSFTAHQPGRGALPAASLSVGQKGMFAVAFRYAVNRVFNADIGMMFLDEPTEGIDEDNLRYFADSLHRLSRQLKGNRQLVMITHNHNLISAFEQVVIMEAS